MPEKSDASVEEILSRHRQELDRLKNALGLLGITPCSCCETFVRRSDPGALFEADEPVCYDCIREWWPGRSAQLDAKDRETLEGKLVFWLRQYHRAETVKDPAKLPDPSLQELHIVARCLECRGTGKMMGEERCRFCEGRGMVSVIVVKKQPA